MVRLGAPRKFRPIAAFELFHPPLQCVDLLQQLLRGGLLRQCGTSQHRRAQAADENTEASHVFPRFQAGNARFPSSLLAPAPDQADRRLDAA
jgi:hypothetical protein